MHFCRKFYPLLLLSYKPANFQKWTMSTLFCCLASIYLFVCLMHFHKSSLSTLLCCFAAWQPFNATKKNPMAWVRELTIPTVWPPLIGEVSVNFFADKGASRSQRGGSPYGHNLCFLDRSRYFFFQVAPQLYSRGWVDSLHLTKFGSAGNRTWTSWSVARNSDH
jgi:hypothetical protein